MKLHICLSKSKNTHPQRPVPNYCWSAPLLFFFCLLVDITCQNLCFERLPVLLPVLDLLCVHLHLRVQLREQGWNVSCGKWSIQFQGVKQFESLGVVFDGFLACITSFGLALFG